MGVHYQRRNSTSTGTAKVNSGLHSFITSVPVKCFVRLLLWWNRPTSHLRLLSSCTASQTKHVLKVNNHAYVAVIFGLS